MRADTPRPAWNRGTKSLYGAPMMDELPPDPGPVIEPHSLFVYGQRPDGRIMVACADCDGEIVGIAPDKDKALTVAGAHGRHMRGE